MSKKLGLFFGVASLLFISSAQAMEDEKNSIAHALNMVRNVVDKKDITEDEVNVAVCFLEGIEKLMNEGSECAFQYIEEVTNYREILGNRIKNNKSEASSSRGKTQFEEDAELARALAEMDMRPSNPIAAVAKKIHNHAEIGKLRGKFAPIKAFIEASTKTHQNADVHFMDGFYTTHAPTLTEVAKTLFPENGKLSLEEVKASLKQLIKGTPYLLENYDYAGVKVPLPEMEGYIDQTYANDMPVELCALTFNLAQQMLAAGNDIGIHRLFDAIVENKLTNGGCLQGRQNRQFVALSIMLMHSEL